MTAPDARFALDLHQRLAGERTFVWSPYSVASALGVVAAGARGRTRDELTKVLGDPAAAAAALSAGAIDALGVANTLWADLSLPVAPGYLSAVKAWPGGAARGADFRGDPEAARAEVNADVARSTRDLIRDLIPAGLVSRDTRAIVVNALYLRSSWVTPFERGATRPQVFHTPGGDVEVPTMRVTTRLPYARRDGWTVVSVPAADGVVADVLLPDGPLTRPADLPGLLDATRPREVTLELPRLKVHGQASLAEPLQDLGLRTLFTGDADLTGITDGSEPLRLDAAVHKAVLTLDESGLEGAAATALLMTRLASISPPPRPVRVTVDRPFLLLIRHRPTHTLYFHATIPDPR